MSWHERPYADDSYDSSRPQPRFIDNPMAWSLGMGSVSGIRIRIHFIFILYLLTELLQARGGAFAEARWLGLLFGIVLLHEFGHCMAARAVGGDAREIMLWPLGGLASVHAPQTPWAQFVTTAGGPLVNVVICLLTAAILVVSAGTVLAVPFNPFHAGTSYYYLDAPWKLWVYLVFNVSYLLLLFNLIPMYPLDGGRLLHSILWPRLGLTRALRTSTTIGMIGALGLGVLGLQRGEFLLIGIAVFGYLTCLQERRMLAMGLTADESGYGEPWESRPRRRRQRGWLSPLGNWRRRRLARREALERQRMREQEDAVDRILLKVHQQGMHTLTRSEKRMLEMATRRQRDEPG